MGLYDTVATFGIAKVSLGMNDTRDLNLDVIGRHAKKVSQLTEADEYREYFTLTNISSTGPDYGKQIFLPRAHSDIGGGYRDNSTEKQTILEIDASDVYKALEDQGELITAGWYKKMKLQWSLTIVF